MPANNEPMFVQQNGAAGFVPSANGLGFVSQFNKNNSFYQSNALKNAGLNAGNVGPGGHVSQCAGTLLPYAGHRDPH